MPSREKGAKACLGSKAGHFLQSGLSATSEELRLFPAIFSIYVAEFLCSPDCMAEGEGFEPPVPFQVQRFSRPPVSTTHTSLRAGLQHFIVFHLLNVPLRCPWIFPLDRISASSFPHLEQVRRRTASGRTSTTKPFYPDLVIDRRGSKGGQRLRVGGDFLTSLSGNDAKTGAVVRPRTARQSRLRSSDPEILWPSPLPHPTW